MKGINNIDNKEKENNYRQLKGKLKRAMALQFWMEACMIEYAILEDRTSSILDHANICKNAYDTNKHLHNKVNSIKHQIGKGHPIISKKVSSQLMDDIIKWKDSRNDIVHRICSIRFDSEELKDIAEEGKRLVDLITNDNAKVKRLADKLAKED